MSKKVYILVGVLILLGLIGLVFWVFSQSSIGRPTSLKEVVKMDCATAQVPFACYLDKAMAAKDPNLCLSAGAAKKMDCLEAYKEILGVEVDCAVIQDADFQRECMMASQNILPENEDVSQPIIDSEIGPEVEVVDENNVDLP